MDINTCFATTEGYRALALYSHLIPAVATFILGLFAYLRAHDTTKAVYFLGFASMLTTWLISDLVVWTSNAYPVVAAFWEPLDFVEILFFLLLFGFIVTDLFPKKTKYLPLVLVAAAAIPFWITLTGNAVLEMNQAVCEMVGNDFLAHYKVWIEGGILAATFIVGLCAFCRKNIQKDERMRVSLIVLSTVLFMGIFSWSEFIATSTDIFEINLYALFTLPIFVLSLTIAITSYSTFNLGTIATRVLFYVFLVLAATQFFFVGNMTEFLLAAMSFSVIFALGILLFFASEREMRQRMQIEKQEKELELANQKQESLLHFISHEIKGYLTEGQNAFAGIIEGDFGDPSPKIKSVSETALTRMRAGVATVMNILDASNLKKGTVNYAKDSFDFKASVIAEIEKLKDKAAQKGLELKIQMDESKTYTTVGDSRKIAEHVIRNLVDNSIRYTPKGSVIVSLSRSAQSIHFSVKDTGVGITPDDMKRLFTEGGHGKDSIKVNVDSTGYGLFVAKQVVDAHDGNIWAESEGAGKGSEFIVELPAA